MSVNDVVVGIVDVVISVVAGDGVELCRLSGSYISTEELKRKDDSQSHSKYSDPDPQGSLLHVRSPFRGDISLAVVFRVY